MQIAFIGAGNMAEALISGGLAAGSFSPAELVLADANPARLAEMSERYGTRTAAGNSAAVRGADVVVLSVKPQQMPEVLADLKGTVSPQTLLISIAAGVPCHRIEQGLGRGVRVVRVMPNTPALVRMGASGIAGGVLATDADLALAKSLFDAVGTSVVLAEDQIDAVTALSGSGPAYVFYLIESMLQAAAELGVRPEDARELVLQTVEGAARLARSSGESPAELRQRVTSKGGTTAAAVAMFDACGVGEGLQKGVLAAAARSRELAAGA